MNETTQITGNIFSDIKGLSDGERLFLRKKYKNTKNTTQEWEKICKQESIIIKSTES